MKDINFNNAQFAAAYGSFKQLQRSDRAEIAFAGRSNVGKSSLINRIFSRKGLARVSATPGKTATINFYSVSDIYIVDLPGYGYAKVSRGEKRRWSELIGGYLGDVERDLRLVFQLIDIRHAPSADDIQMINYMIDTSVPFVILFTKADKLTNNQRAQRMEAFAQEIPCFEDMTCIITSAEKGEGIEAVQEIIAEVSAPDDAEESDGNE